MNKYKIINFDFIWLEALFSGKSCKIKLIIKKIRIIRFFSQQRRNKILEKSVCCNNFKKNSNSFQLLSYHFV